ncbi:hypothetical protein BBJ28_00006547 [Nothophytophthora sp. Chile5]|nr:hypothetical protein BBJ28_00006547 [Nothophytophthora sp. Chile5]
MADKRSVVVKRGVLVGIALAAYVAWSLGVWGGIAVRLGILPRLRPVLLLAGDSLTEKGTDPKRVGWVTLLQHRYARSADVMPRGLSGYNTKYVLALWCVSVVASGVLTLLHGLLSVSRWFLEFAMPVIQREIASGAYSPAFITVWLGANDAALPEGSNAEQHVPIEMYRENLVKIVHSFQESAPNARILLITPSHVDDAIREKRARKAKGPKKGLVDRTNAATGQYAHACVETAGHLGIPVLDLYSYFNDNVAKWKRNSILEDGLHFNAKGNTMVDNQLKAKIEAEFPDLVHRLKSWQLPDFSVMFYADSKPPKARRPTLLLLGDSITQDGTNPLIGGWICLLQHRYNRSADVVPRGFCGYNTKYFVQHVLPGLKRDLASWLAVPTLIVTLWLGANDSALLSGHEGVLHVPLDEYRTNLREIVGAIREKAPTASILLITPPAINDPVRLDLSPIGKLDRSNAESAEYGRVCIEEAATLGVSVLNMHQVFNALPAQERAACQHDGLHLTTKGNALVADEVGAAIEREFPALMKQLDTWEHPDFLDLMAADAAKQ